jgi:hypothetical protein
VTAVVTASAPGHRWGRIRLACTAASTALLALAVIILGLLTPGYSQSADAVSRLASPGEPWALPARAVIVAYGLMVMIGAAPLGRYMERRGQVLEACLTLYGLASVVAGLAPKDQPGAVPTAISEVHIAASVLAGSLAITAMMLVSVCGPTRVSRYAAAVLALLTTLAATAFKYAWGTPTYGVRERIVLALGMCWISAFAIRALILAGGQRRLWPTSIRWPSGSRR